VRGRILLIGLSLATGAIVCAAVLFIAPGPQSWAALQKASKLLLALAFVVTLAEVLFRSMRLCVVVRAADGFLPLWTAVRITLTGDFAAAITPSRIGGEPARLYGLTRSGLSSGTAGAVLFGEFLTDLFALTFLIAVAFGLSGTPASPLQALWPVGALALAGGGVIGLALRWPASLDWLWERLLARRPVAWALRRARLEAFRPGRWAAEVRGRSGRLFTTGRRWMGVGGAYALFHTTARFTILPLLAAAFAAPLDLRSAILIQMAIFYGFALVPTPGGSGLPEAAFTAAISLSDPAAPVGLLLILWRFLTFYMGSVTGGLLSAGLFRRSRNR
jgi:uncharacterized membrane protein YbhN (UPF0104 family)